MWYLWRSSTSASKKTTQRTISVNVDKNDSHYLLQNHDTKSYTCKYDIDIANDFSTKAESPHQSMQGDINISLVDIDGCGIAVIKQVSYKKRPNVQCSTIAI